MSARKKASVTIFDIVPTGPVQRPPRKLAIDSSCRAAPASPRLWCGATVEPDDVRALMHWIEWAQAQVRSGLAIYLIAAGACLTLAHGIFVLNSTLGPGWARVAALEMTARATRSRGRFSGRQNT